MRHRVPKKALTLRDYQAEGVARIERALYEENKKSVLAVAPTAAGKGTMAVALIRDAAERGERVLFLVHRREILYDMRERLMEVGITPGVVMHKIKRDRTAYVQVASVQTLVNEAGRKFDLVVVDEAHHYAAVEWAGVMKRTRAERVVGFTATPQRKDGKPLGDMFGHLLSIVPYRELLSRGYIVPCRLLRPECPLQQDLAQDPVDAYLWHARGTKCFMFVRNLQVARDAVVRLQEAGVPAAVISAHTRHDARAKAMEDFRAGRISVIVNFYTMTEGVDVPDVETIVLGRAIAHEGAYMQMVGRGLRASPGKKLALVLDLTGASYQHGLPLDERTYALRGKNPIGRPDEIEEYKIRERPSLELQNILNVELVEATEAQQKRFGKRRIHWAQVGLGQRRDEEIGNELGVSPKLVAAMRRRFGIKSFRQATFDALIDWDTEPLGKVTDRSLAELLGVPVDTVLRARQARGIPALERGRGLRVDIDWDQQPLGQVADKVLAKQLNVSSSTVLLARKARGIPPFGMGAKLASWEAIPLGTMPDTHIAARYSLTVDSVRNARKRRGIPTYDPDSERSYVFRKHGKEALAEADGIDWDKVGLGERADPLIARELGVSIARVKAARLDRRIPPMVAGRPKMVRDWDKLGLGKDPDLVVAERTGFSVSYIKRLRREKGLSRSNNRWDTRRQGGASAKKKHQKHEEQDRCDRP